MSFRARIVRLSVGAAFALVAIAAVIIPGQARAVEFTGKVKIAAVQTNPTFRDKVGNLNDMEARALDAAANGADLIVFPELSLTGYKYKTRAEMELDAEPVPGPSTLAMVEVAKQAKAYIAFGMVASDGDGLYDEVVLVGPEGYVGKYAKITMGHASEAVLFTRGPAAPPVFDTSIGKIGIASCYDGAFPENARLMGIGGAQIMVLIDTENGTTWRDYVRSRAAENGSFAVVTNRVGTERNSTFNGYSLIADPNYNLLANASTSNVETIYATVDLSDVSRTFLNQRRPELYRAVTRPMDPAVLGLSSDPQSSVTGTATDLDISFSTTAIPAGTATTAKLVDSSEDVIAQGSGTLGVDQGVIEMTVPAGAPAGVHTLRVTADGFSKSIPFTVKDFAKPGVLGTMPAAGASAASTIYIGFDTDITPSNTVPLTLTPSGGSPSSLTGTINMSVIDNRLTAAYSGLSAGTTYTVTLPANAVTDNVSGIGNDAYSFDFTVAGTPTTTVGAVAQFDPVALDKSANVASIISTMNAASSQAVKFLVFPELAITGTQFASHSAANDVAEAADGPSVQAIATAAASLNMTVVVGLVESSGGKLYNTQVLVGPSGVIGAHRSTHLSATQAEIFDAGNTVSGVYDTPSGPVGLISGYESYFPEVARSLAIRGALLIAGGYSETGTVWRELVRTRGSENKVYVLAANQGTSGGKSLIASTSRAINAELAGTAAGIAKATLNLTTIANRYYSYVDQSSDKVRTTHYYLDRRPEIYAPLSAKSSSTTVLSLNTGSIVAGSGDITATVAVTGYEGTVVSGDVTLKAGEVVLGTGPLSAGSAVITVPSTALSAGANTLTATYSGNDELVSSLDTEDVSVTKATPSVSATLAAATVAAGQPGSLSVGVSAPGIPGAGGAVTVALNGSTLPAVLVGGSASVALPTLTKAGQYPITVTYAGDSLVEGGSATVVLTVKKVAPSLSVKLTKSTVTAGAKASAAVTLTASGLTVDGVVSVSFRGKTVKAVVTGGVAKLKLPAATKVGKFKLKFNYAGSDSLESGSVTATLKVKRKK
ncbi:MAG: Ig-like domain repeat protein [Thermoleophilaceae bacterium]|nr:Ig-like domain repeat protein [Thermoleophilaceae bacterium]